MKTKKETTLSVLKDIRNLLQKAENRANETAVDAINVEAPELDNFFKVEFPEKTVKEIVDECNNKLGEGKLIWSDWMLNKDFYTKEKSRPGIRYVSKEILHFGKSWDECKTLIEKEGEMMNFAEMIYFIKWYYETFKKYPDSRWSWTSSRSSDGGIVDAGFAGAYGLRVGSDGPGYSASCLGLRFFRSMKS